MEERMSRSSSLPIIAVDFDLISRLRVLFVPACFFEDEDDDEDDYAEW
jgi:hypothetical protein